MVPQLVAGNPNIKTSAVYLFEASLHKLQTNPAESSMADCVHNLQRVVSDFRK